MGIHNKPVLNSHVRKNQNNRKKMNFPSLWCLFSTFWVRKCDRNRTKILFIGKARAQK